MINQGSVNGQPEKIQIRYNRDLTEAYLTFLLTDEELKALSSEMMVNEILQELKRCGIVFGVRKEFLFQAFESGKEYIIAQGIAPVHGTDSIIKMYEIPDAKTEVGDNENMNYYDVVLIHPVKAGTWLGERINATEGAPGKTVKGETILQKKGINYPLHFDVKSVVAVESETGITLFARYDGVPSYDDKKIFISKFLMIQGDVGYGTGNIDFDGSVHITGSVCDGFSVIATNDIEIRGALGIGNVKRIESRSGSVFLKGGIASKENTMIKAKNNIFARFLDNVQVYAEGLVNVGFYILNSEVTASEVVVESMTGRILGGVVNALARVCSPVIGNEAEKKTVINVTGIDRTAVLEQKTGIELKIEKYKLFKKTLQEAVDYKLEILKGEKSLEILNKLYLIEEELANLDLQHKQLESLLKVRGAGEVQVLKKVFPGVVIAIKEEMLQIQSEIAGCLFYGKDNQIIKS